MTLLTACENVIAAKAAVEVAHNRLSGPGKKQTIDSADAALEAADEVFAKVCTSEAVKRLCEALGDALPLLETLHSILQAPDTRATAWRAIVNLRAALQSPETGDPV